MSAGDVRHHHRTTVGTVLVLVELASLALSAPPLSMAAYVMSNLIGVHDNSALNYSIFATVYATPGVLLLALAVSLRTRGRLRQLPQQRRWSPGSRLATLTSSEWAWAAAVMAAATTVWWLYLHGLA